MSLRIYNTLTRQKDEFVPLEEGQVLMYVCGPTVYDKAHIGHAMSSLVFDIVRRYLEFRGFHVRHVMNYTDVDDKIIIRANHEKRDPVELAEEYIAEYMRHLADLNILPATVFPRATEEIDHIIDMTARMVDDDIAYPADGDVYYRVEKKPDYGKLSGRKLEDMQAGSRVDVDNRKEHPMDFALWKAAKEGEPAWQSPWGAGRPGWHIECSAMALHHLGRQIDIHGGGNDLIFPHHENEIAQSESVTGAAPFARYWMHNGMMQLSGEAMSKSTGNLVTIDDFLAEHEAGAMRLIILNSSYRRPLSYSPEIVEQAEAGLERLRSALRPALPNTSGAPAAELSALENDLANLEAGFIAAMDDDFNSSAALALLFDLVKKVNAARVAGATDAQLQPAQSILTELAAVLGLELEAAPEAATDVDPQPFIILFDSMNAKLAQPLSREGDDLESVMQALLALRKQFRAEKQWDQADGIRDQLADLGVLVEDSAGGSTWRWK